MTPLFEPVRLYNLVDFLFELEQNERDLGLLFGGSAFEGAEEVGDAAQFLFEEVLRLKRGYSSYLKCRKLAQNRFIKPQTLKSSTDERSPAK